MTDNERELLERLFAADYGAGKDGRDTGVEQAWLRPMDVGGSTGSHHSTTLARMVGKGWAERMTRNGDKIAPRGDRGSYLYRITPKGVAALHNARATAAA